MIKKIISTAAVPTITVERIRQDVCKIGVVFYDHLVPLDITAVPFEFSVLSGTYRVIHKTNEQLIRTAINRLEITLTDADKAKLSGQSYQIQLRRINQQLTELVGDLVFIRGTSGQASGLQTPPDILLRYENGQPNPEATVLVIQGPQGTITPELEQLRADTLANKNTAIGAAQTATTKARQAFDSAAAAAGSATDANNSKQAAGGFAESAAGSASTATNKAGQAFDSAAAAAGSATDANNSKQAAGGFAQTASDQAALAIAAKNTAVTVAGNIIAVTDQGTDYVELSTGGSILTTDYPEADYWYTEIEML